MANYINTVTGKYPVTEREIRNEFSNTSFPLPFQAPDSYAVVFDAPKPSYDSLTQIVRETIPVKTNKGHYEQQFEVADLDAETAAANIERHKTEFNAGVWRQIEQIEKEKQMPRHIRDLIPLDHPARFKVDAVESEIAELKGKLL